MKTKIIASLVLGMSGLTSTLDSAQAADLEACDLAYSHRGQDLVRAVLCYGSLASAADADTKLKLYERSFIALSAIVNDSPKTPSEGEAIAKGLNLLGEMSGVYGKTADYFYWRAVFTSFDAIRKDRGSALPTHMFGVLKSIQQDLRQAIEINPTIHGYGPHRVLGIMHTKMPGVVGGDKVLAEKMLKESYTRFPVMSLNHVSYGKILVVNGKEDEAKAVLGAFLKMSDAQLDPYPETPLRSLKPETDRDRREAKALLDQINEG